MQRKAKEVSHTRVARTVIAFVLVTGCITACCVIYFLWALSDEDTPPTPIESTVSLDFGTLPQNAEVADWYGLARQALNATSEEPSFLLSSLFGRAACDDPSRIEKFVFGFHAVKLHGIVPHRFFAHVLIEPNTEVAQVTIEDLGPGWRNYHELALSPSTKEPSEVISIADNHGGRAIRAALQDECTLNFALSEDGWVVSYRDIENMHTELLVVFIDANTGVVERVER